MRIEQALEKYILQLKGNGRSEHTVAQVRRHVRLFEAWLESTDESTELAQISHEHVALFLASDAVAKRADGNAGAGQCALPVSSRADRALSYQLQMTTSTESDLNARRTRQETDAIRRMDKRTARWSRKGYHRQGTVARHRWSRMVPNSEALRSKN